MWRILNGIKHSRLPRGAKHTAGHRRRGEFLPCIGNQRNGTHGRWKVGAGGTAIDRRNEVIAPSLTPESRNKGGNRVAAPIAANAPLSVFRYSLQAMTMVRLAVSIVVV